MMTWLLPLLLGLACGTVSAWGVGGGTLLLLVMTLLLGVDARTAQCVNLLFFLPTAGLRPVPPRGMAASSTPPR